jgi:hypothetical protein
MWRGDVKSNQPRGSRIVRRAAILGLLLALRPAAMTLAAPPLPPAEVRERRWIKEEQPLWREALALPQAALGVVTWPLKQTLFWAERVELHRRVAGFVLDPVPHPGTRERHR